MSSVKENLIAARTKFQAMNGKSIRAAFMLACKNASNSLDTLSALQANLPNGFHTFEEFEASRNWRKKDAYAIFDRAIAAAEAAQ